MSYMTWQDQLTAGLERGHITDADLPYIRQFIEKESNKTGITKVTLRKAANQLLTIGRLAHARGVRNLGELTTEDVFAISGEIRNNYESNSQRNTLNFLKRFSVFLHKTYKVPLDLDEIKTIKLPATNWKSKKADDLLSPEEILKVIEAAEGVRDRAIIALMYDASLRPKEIQTMRWNQLIRDEYGFRLRVSEKTHYEREIRLTKSLPFLLRWSENYPEGKPEGDKPVFVKEYREGGNYRELGPMTVSKMILRMREKTGINRLKPSIFRPSAITHLAESGTDLTYIMMQAWGNMATKMIRTYAKPSRAYMDKIALKNSGIEIDEGKTKYRTESIQELWKPRKCPVCSTSNPASLEYCGKCGMGLTEKAIQKKENAVRSLDGENYTPEEIDRAISILQSLKIKK